MSTPSYHQVVQPLYSRSIGRWHNYRFAFDALMPALLPFIRAWGYTETAVVKAYTTDDQGREPQPDSKP